MFWIFESKSSVDSSQTLFVAGKGRGEGFGSNLWPRKENLVYIHCLIVFKRRIFCSQQAYSSPINNIAVLMFMGCCFLLCIFVCAHLLHAHILVSVYLVFLQPFDKNSIFINIKSVNQHWIKITRVRCFLWLVILLRVVAADTDLLPFAKWLPNHRLGAPIWALGRGEKSDMDIILTQAPVLPIYRFSCIKMCATICAGHASHVVGKKVLFFGGHGTL